MTTTDVPDIDYAPVANHGRAGPAATVPRIQVGTAPDTIRTLRSELTGGLLPGTYVSAGDLVHMEAVSGSATTAAADEDSPLPVAASPVTPASLAGLLAQHTYLFRLRTRKTEGGVELFEEEVTPPREALSAVLATKTWPGVPALHGIIGAPVLRRDGTLLQQPNKSYRVGREADSGPVAAGG